MGKKLDKRRRNWVVVVYPDDCYKDWKSRLNELNVNYICSPLHDKDINPDGEKKKAHYHVIFYFEGNKSFNQIWEISKHLGDVEEIPKEDLKDAKPNYYTGTVITEKIHGVASNPQAVENMMGQVRYLVHADNPEKYQYNKEDIEVRGNYDIAPAFKKGEFTVDKHCKDMIEFITENNVISFKQFLGYAMKKRSDDWFNILMHNANISNIMRALINEGREDARREEKLNEEAKLNQVENISRIVDMIMDKRKNDKDLKDIAIF